MKHFLLVVMMFLPFSVMADIPEFNTLADKYAVNNSVMVTTIDRDMIALFAGEMEELDMVDKILVILAEEPTLGKAIVEESKAIAKRANAERLIDASNDGTDVEVYVLKDGEMITDIIVIIADDNQMGASVISGRIKPENLGKLIQVQM